MKKVIDGKIYNTETAILIAENKDRGFSKSDFQWEETSLYKTKKGNVFLAGKGGPMSRWAESVGSNGRCGGHGIEVLTPAEALEWCEANDVDAETIAKHFTVEEA